MFLAENGVSLPRVWSSPSVSLSRPRQLPSRFLSPVASLLVSASVWSPLWSRCISPSVPQSGSVVPSSVYTNGLSPLVSSSPTFSTTPPRTDRITPRIAFPLRFSSSGLRFLLVAWPSFLRCALSSVFTLVLHVSNIRFPVSPLADQESS